MSRHSPLGQIWLFPAKMVLSEPKTGRLPFSLFLFPQEREDKNCLKKDTGANVAFCFSVVFSDSPFEMIFALSYPSISTN